MSSQFSKNRTQSIHILAILAWWKILKNPFHMWNFPPRKIQMIPLDPAQDDDDSGDVTWVEFVRGMSSDQFQAGAHPPKNV